jgi:hypothetical protein
MAIWKAACWEQVSTLFARDWQNKQADPALSGDIDALATTRGLWFHLHVSPLGQWPWRFMAKQALIDLKAHIGEPSTE